MLYDSPREGQTQTREMGGQKKHFTNQVQHRLQLQKYTKSIVLVYRIFNSNTFSCCLVNPLHDTISLEQST